MSDNILEMRGITKQFIATRALDNVNFVVGRGSIHALVGENGAGKSTLMKVLSGLWPYGNLRRRHCIRRRSMQVLQYQGQRK